MGSGERERVESTHPLQALLDRVRISRGKRVISCVKLKDRWHCGALAYVARCEVDDGMANEMWPLRAQNVRVVTENGSGVSGVHPRRWTWSEAFLPEDVIWFQTIQP